MFFISILQYAEIQNRVAELAVLAQVDASATIISIIAMMANRKGIMSLLLIVKAVVVVAFLGMFLRRPRIITSIGLLTVTTAVLLDTFLGTFGRDEMIAEIGFFYYVITGMLLGGGAVWAWGVLHPLIAPPTVKPLSMLQPVVRAESKSEAPESAASTSIADPAAQAASPYDRHMLYEEIRLRFGSEDILDLIFDMGINENEVVTVNQSMDELIANLMELAVEHDQIGDLALAVERILTPPHPSKLPRVEHINASSPPTVLRHYLLAYFDLEGLQKLAAELGIDWEQLGSGNKKRVARELLLYLYRRNRIDEMIDLL